MSVINYLLEKLKEVEPNFVYNLSLSLHRNPDDFEDGDISDRIFQYEYYILDNQFPISDLEEWEVQPYLVNDFIRQYKQNSDYPPIVIGKDNEMFTIIDGIHRANALHELGLKTVKAYVGYNATS